MKKIADFFKNNKHVVTWTMYYVAITFLILYLLFNFNIFSPRHWYILARAKLTGFAGFVFGVIMLSLIPIYIATTAIVIRNKKTLFEIKLKFKKDEKKEEDSKEEKAEEETIEEIILPEGLPTELKAAFIRAKRNVSIRQESGYNKYNGNGKDKNCEDVNKEPVEEEHNLPLPDSFDFGAMDSEADVETDDAPVFKDLSFFDTPVDTKEDKKTQKKAGLEKYLESNGIQFIIDGDIIIANNLAIITHSDSDFWIADDDSWFAAGKQKDSPITEVTAAAKKHNCRPAIYLEQKNILDLDKKISEWESMDIKVIQDLEEI